MWILAQVADWNQIDKKLLTGLEQPETCQFGIKEIRTIQGFKDLFTFWFQGTESRLRCVGIGKVESLEEVRRSFPSTRRQQPRLEGEIKEGEEQKEEEKEENYESQEKGTPASQNICRVEWLSGKPRPMRLDTVLNKCAYILRMALTQQTHTDQMAQNNRWLRR